MRAGQRRFGNEGPGAVLAGRDIALAELTGGRLHIAHVSTAGAVRLVREAKARGLRVTAEVTPHHLFLTDEAVRGYDPNTKMYPPLRPAADVEALRQALQDGTIDAIATDHAPHDLADKEVEFDQAPVGIIGLETSLPVTLRLVHAGVLTLAEAIAKLTWGPSQVLGLGKGTLRVGGDADVTLIDPQSEYLVDRREFRSKSRNSPFHGWTLKGRAVMTLCAGKVVYSRVPERITYRSAPGGERRPRAVRDGGQDPAHVLHDAEALAAVGIERTTLVVGHCAEQVRALAGTRQGDMAVDYVTNPEYARGSILSLRAARELRLRQQKSILDSVADKLRMLSVQIGAEDQAFCSRFGVGPETARYTDCVAALRDVRSRHDQRRADLFY